MELYKYILGGALCLGSLFSSCSDWLEVEPVEHSYNKLLL